MIPSSTSTTFPTSAAPTPAAKSPAKPLLIPHNVDAQLPIGVFDSGVGGLTVLAALRRRLPHESLIYLGDTARLPYGTKSSGTITRYALQATSKLVERQIKMLVIACNTATAAALPALQQAYPHLPVLGVVEPGAEAACRASRTGNILIMATESTIRNLAYTKAIQTIRPSAAVTGVACSLFVALAEEGWTDDAIVSTVARRYLAPIFETVQNAPPLTAHEAIPLTAEAVTAHASPEPGPAPAAATNSVTAQRGTQPDCLVLGCTHFPPLAKGILTAVGRDIAIVDSAATTAEAAEKALSNLLLLRPQEKNVLPSLQFLTTDAPDRFARVGSIFLGAPIPPEQVELVVL